jgi:hypothetical protein
VAYGIALSGTDLTLSDYGMVLSDPGMTTVMALSGTGVARK